MKGETMFLKRKLTQRKCGFKNIVSAAQFQALGKVDEFLMTDLGLAQIQTKRGLTPFRTKKGSDPFSNLIEINSPIYSFFVFSNQNLIPSDHAI